MKFESVIFKSVLAAASIAGASAASAANPRQALDAEIKEQQKVSRKFRDTVEFLERRLNDDDVKTNAKLRVYIDQKILSFCAMPGWTQFGNWDKKWSEDHIPGVCEREIAAVVERHGMRTVAIPFRSTAENLAKMFYGELRARIPGLWSVKVWETADSCAEYRG